jgi:hypothetical protein
MDNLHFAAPQNSGVQYHREYVLLEIHYVITYGYASDETRQI